MLRILTVFLRKVLLSIHSILLKKLRCQIVLTKAFLFQYIHLFSKKLMRFQNFVSPRAPIQCDMFFKEQKTILEFCFRHIFMWIIFYTYSLTVLFAKTLLRSAIKLEFGRFSWASYLKFSKRLRKRWAIFEIKLKKRNLCLRTNSFP